MEAETSLLTVNKANGQGVIVLFHILNLFSSFADSTFICKVVVSDGITKCLNNVSKVRLMAQ